MKCECLSYALVSTFLPSGLRKPFFRLCLSMLWEHHACIPCMSVMPTTSPSFQLLFPSCIPPPNVIPSIFLYNPLSPVDAPHICMLWAISWAWWPLRQHPWRKQAQWWSAQPPRLWGPWLPVPDLWWDPTDEQFARGQGCCYESCFCRLSSASWHEKMWCMCVQWCTHKYVSVRVLLHKAHVELRTGPQHLLLLKQSLPKPDAHCFREADWPASSWNLSVFTHPWCWNDRCMQPCLMETRTQVFIPTIRALLATEPSPQPTLSMILCRDVFSFLLEKCRAEPSEGPAGYLAKWPYHLVSPSSAHGSSASLPALL